MAFVRRSSSATIASRADVSNTAHTAIDRRRLVATRKRLSPCSAWPNAPRGAARDAKPDGRRPYRSFSAAIGRSGCNVRSIRDDGNKNSCRRRPCDSPRPRLGCPTRKVRAAACGIAETAPGAVPCPPDWPNTSDWPAIATSDAPPGDKLRCNSGSGGDGVRTTVRTLSEGKDGLAGGRGSALDSPPTDWHHEGGPREVLLPRGQVSRRSCYFSARRILTRTGILADNTSLPV
jgi:hypothetical protein